LVLFALSIEPFLWPGIFRSGEVSILCHQPFVEFETVLSHGKFDRMQAWLFDVQVDFVRFVAVLGFGSLHALPAPRVFSFAPLEPLA